jgi:hypothetical protein
MNKIIAIAIAFTLLAAACKTSQNTDQTETQAKEIDAEQLFKDSVKRVEQLILECTPDADLFYTNYVFLDIDNDGIQEMYLKEENSSNAWIFCCGSGNVELIADQDEEHSKLTYCGNIIRMDIHFPSGYTVLRFFELQNSHVVGPDFMECGQMDFETGEPKMQFFVAGNNNTSYPEEKTRPFYEKLDKMLENDGWHFIQNGIEDSRFTPLGFLNGMIGEEPDPSEMEGSEQ